MVVQLGSEKVVGFEVAKMLGFCGFIFQIFFLPNFELHSFSTRGKSKP